MLLLKGVEIFTVGVGIRQNDAILKEMASKPKSKHFFSTPHRAKLTDVLHVIKKKGLQRYEIDTSDIF